MDVKHNCLRRWMLALLLPLCTLAYAAGSNKSEAQVLDTIEYRVFIAVDRAAVEHWGGEEAYRTKLYAHFDRMNEFWNEAGDGRFKYYFRYVPDIQIIYNGSSRQLEHALRNSGCYPNHDVLMIIDSILDHDDEEEGKGWYCGACSSDMCIVILRGRSKKEHEDLFGEWHRCSGIAHELGHYRGVTDLYADRIREKNNPVNGLQYEPDSCVMNNHYKTRRWSDYAVNIINHMALSKRPNRDYPGFFKQMFPENILVNVTVNGKKKKDVKLNLYGSRAKHNDLIATPYRTFVTDKKGQCLITDVPNLYDHPAGPLHTKDLPYNRWFTFVLEAEYKGEKKYVWLPEYEVQMAFFENRDTHEVTIDF